MFQRAEIPVQNAELFESLKGLLDRALAPENVSRLMKTIENSGLRVREFEEVLSQGLLDAFSADKKSARDQYQQLPASDQGQIRELYLTQIEEVSSDVRKKYQKIYQYS